MNTRRQNIYDAHPNTCEWLFSTTEFEEWRDRYDLSTHNGVLWTKGKPGAGKSTLMNHTLSYCERVFGDHLIMAYFFNARGGVLEKTPLGMMRSIVYQLLNKDDALYGVFLDSYYREKRRIYQGSDLQWQQPELKKFIQSIAKQPQLQSKPLLLLVNALDECDKKDVRDIIGFLEALSDNAVNSGVKLRICLSSRHYPRVSMKKNLELTVERRREHKRDINTYVQEKLHTEDDYIKYEVQRKADSIFMWVVLVVAMLNKAHDEGMNEAMQKILDEVPEDLEGIFETLLERGDSNKVELISVLQWVLFSKRPWTPEELYIAAVGKSLPSHEIIQRRIISSSKGLIEVRRQEDSGTEFVQFIHLSVIDFLCRNKRLERLDPTFEPDAISASHARLWACCWSYIKCRDVTSTSKEHMMGLFNTDPFLGYATDYIFDHADEAVSNEQIGDGFDLDITQWLAARDDWLQWLISAIEVKGHPKIPNLYFINGKISAGVIYIFAFAPYQNLLDFAIQKGVDINARVGDYGNALQAASTYRSYEVA